MTKIPRIISWQTPRLDTNYASKFDSFLALFLKIPESDGTCDALKCKLDCRIQTSGLHNSARGIAENCMATGRNLVPDVVGNVWNNRKGYLSITSRQKPPWVIQRIVL
ncbi:MAG: hypothetical protein RID09_17735 [Coleofasciculus sp. G1-WW12-02]|uniref:hypothetical protein n=1 Tax=Coleofasciculus sp. G1-WW12-02 TaxID=3068483 RepID=UPI0033036F7B